MTHPASFRDPDGFVFLHNGELFRQVNPSYLPDYELLMSSGLYSQLVEKGRLVAHEEVQDPRSSPDPAAARILQPSVIPVITYPASWSFRMLQAAAVLTLDIQLKAIEKGMVLKDASAYNIQFAGPNPIFIDTLSFERWSEGNPWFAYGQFCRHFLAPLALMSYGDVSLHTLWSAYPDGIPLPVATQLLPLKARFSMGLYLHLFLHASQLNATPRGGAKTAKKFSKQELTNLANHLKAIVKKLEPAATPSNWIEYYENDVEQAYQVKKREVISGWLKEQQPGKVLDVGANRGQYSYMAAETAACVIAAEADPTCVDAMWLEMREKKVDRILPICFNAANPEPGIGWMNEERSSVLERIGADSVLALAVTHHLAITYAIPFHRQAEFFFRLGKEAFVEFIPKPDPKVQLLLKTHRNPFDSYSRETFVAAFEKLFEVRRSAVLSDSGRELFWLVRKPGV